jgi:hypothetical protein
MRLGHRLRIPGNFPDLLFVALAGVGALWVVFMGISMTTVEGWGPEFAILGLVSGSIFFVGASLVGVWDFGESLLIGYGVYYRKVRKVDIVAIDYEWTPLVPFGKQLCLLMESGRLILIPGGQWRNRHTNKRTVTLLSSVLPRARMPRSI